MFLLKEEHYSGITEKQIDPTNRGNAIGGASQRATAPATPKPTARISLMIWKTLFINSYSDWEQCRSQAAN